ncbi:peptide chain release factor 1-like, mitochondrial [Bacillus rossius redtenbacheri]|uniref:peptide chain release factor 1-like, mitochondrial n=1 Tax=Bacillus rossius redtenbacheri TaxID=93214 RepID=UPI002FDCFAB9
MRRDLRYKLETCNIKIRGSEDKELASLAEEERAGYVERIRDLEAQLRHALVPEAPGGDCSEVVVEVSAGVGGQEAMLFAHELFHMYRCYADHKGWQAQVAELEQSDLGGLRHASLLVCGDQAYQHLRHEAGVHRVQRVPATEKSGRVHTSTVTVATLPQPAEVEVRLRDKDLQVETKRASGAGGQHVNTTDSAVRVTHLPTGLVVDCQVDRSQIKNREMALRTLRARLYQRETDRQLAETAAARKLQVGSSLRSEKIRTYNFNQDRVTDHRLGSTLHNLRGFLSGAEALDCLIRDLDDAEKASRLQQILEQ